MSGKPCGARNESQGLPSLPNAYAAIAPLWLLTLLGGETVVRGRALVWIGLAWLTLEYVWPVDWPLDPRVASALNAVPMATILALVALGVRSDIGFAKRPATTDLPAPTPVTG